MRTRRLVLALVLLAPARALPCQQPTESDYPKLAGQFLAAFRAKNAQRVQALAKERSPRNEPFLVADFLLVQYRDHRGLAEGPVCLAAARRYAQLVGEARQDARGVGDLVEAWAAQDDAALAARTAFRRQVHDLRHRLDRKDAAALADSEALLANPMPRETCSFWLFWVRSVFLAANWRHDEAERGFAQAAAVAQAMGWVDKETDALEQQALCARRRGAMRQAVAPLERLLATAEAMGDARNVVRMRGNLATAHGFLGDRERWLELCEQNLAAAHQRGELGTVAQLQLEKSAVEMAAGRPDAALQCNRAARDALAKLDRADKLGDAGFRAIADGQLGALLLRTGRIAEGLAHLELAAAVLQNDRGDPERFLDNLIEQADAWLLLQRPELARPFLDQALAQARAIGNFDVVARAQGRLLEPQLATAAGPERERAMREVLADMAARGAADAALAQRLRIAEAEFGQGRHAEALATIDAVIGTAAASAKADVALLARLLRCRVHLARERFADAAADAMRAQHDAGAQQDRDAEAEACTRLAEARLGLDEPAAAAEHAEHAVAILHGLGRGLGETTGLGLRRAVRAAADVGLAALWQQHRERPSAELARRAFALVESSRALLLAAGLEPRLGPGADDAELSSAEGFARLSVRQYQRELVAAQAARDAAAETAAARALETALRAQQLATARLQRAALAAGDVGTAEPVAAAKFQADLPEDLAFVHFQAARADLLALVADRGELRFLRVGPAAEIGRHANAWRLLLANAEPETAEAERTTATALGAKLLDPIAKHLQGRRRLWIAADGPLASVPFEALLVSPAEGSPTQRLVESFEVGYAPSATVATVLHERQHQRPAGRGLLALGDPDYPAPKSQGAHAAVLRDLADLRRLPHSGEEVEQLAALVADALPAAPRTVLLRAEATRGRLDAALAGVEQRLLIAHFACHGFFDERWGALSGLVLGGGEVLNAAELARMRLPADLLVLSACKTAAGEEQSGEGVFGLVRGAFLAGSDRIVVSQWQVADTGTRDFMAAFYEEHLRHGRAPSAALRAASLRSLRSGGAAARPFHWAGFVLFGAWN